MVRYTDNLIPVMTSDTTPSGVASASSQYDNSNYLAWKAFDETNKDNLDCWASNTSNISWLQYDFGKNNGKIVSKYSITSRKGVDPTSSLKSWTFEGFNLINNSWDILDKRENQPIWEANEIREYIFNNNVKYERYRININSNHGREYICIGQFKMFESIENKFLIKQNLNYYSIKPKFYNKGNYIPLTLEGVTTPNNNDFVNNGFDDLEDLLLENDKVSIARIDKGNIGNGKYFSMDFPNDFLGISEVNL